MAREWEVALLHELPAAEREARASAYAGELVSRYGVADVAIHQPSRRRWGWTGASRAGATRSRTCVRPNGSQGHSGRTASMSGISRSAYPQTASARPLRARARPWATRHYVSVAGLVAPDGRSSARGPRTRAKKSGAGQEQRGRRAVDPGATKRGAEHAKKPPSTRRRTGAGSK